MHITKESIEFIQTAANIITSVGVIFSIWVGILQMRKNNRVFKSQVFNNVYQRLDLINTLAYENPEIEFKLLNDFDLEWDTHNPINSYIDIIKTFFYEMFFHHKNGLMTEEEWESWNRTITSFFTKPYIRQYWEINRSEYGKGFSDYIDNIIKNKTPNHPRWAST